MNRNNERLRKAALAGDAGAGERLWREALRRDDARLAAAVLHGRGARRALVALVSERWREAQGRGAEEAAQLLGLRLDAATCDALDAALIALHEAAAGVGEAHGVPAVLLRREVVEALACARTLAPGLGALGLPGRRHHHPRAARPVCLATQQADGSLALALGLSLGSRPPALFDDGEERLASAWFGAQVQARQPALRVGALALQPRLEAAEQDARGHEALELLRILTSLELDVAHEGDIHQLPWILARLSAPTRAGWLPQVEQALATRAPRERSWPLDAYQGVLQVEPPQPTHPCRSLTLERVGLERADEVGAFLDAGHIPKLTGLVLRGCDPRLVARVLDHPACEALAEVDLSDPPPSAAEEVVALVAHPRWTQVRSLHLRHAPPGASRGRMPALHIQLLERCAGLEALTIDGRLDIAPLAARLGDLPGLRALRLERTWDGLGEVLAALARAPQRLEALRLKEARFWTERAPTLADLALLEVLDAPAGAGLEALELQAYHLAHGPGGALRAGLPSRLLALPLRTLTFDVMAWPDAGLTWPEVFSVLDMPRLRALRLGVGADAPRGAVSARMTPLLQAPTLPRLERLELLHLEALPPGFAPTLARSSRTLALRALLLRDTALDDAALGALARARSLPYLEHLAFRAFHVSAGAMRALLESPMPLRRVDAVGAGDALDRLDWRALGDAAL